MKPGLYTNSRGETREVTQVDQDGVIWWKLPGIDGEQWATPAEWLDWEMMG